MRCNLNFKSNLISKGKNVGIFPKLSIKKAESKK